METTSTAAKAGCVVFERGDCRPLAPSDVAVVSAGGMHMPGALFATVDGDVVAYGARYDLARVVSARSRDFRTFQAAGALAFAAGDVTGAETPDGRRALYVMAETGIVRVAIDAYGEFRESRPVTLRGLPDGVAVAWPQAVGLTDGRVVLAFVVPQQRAFLAVSDESGLVFDVAAAPAPEGELRGVLAHVGTTRNGRIVFTYQVADASWAFRSYVRAAERLGRPFGPATLIHEDDDNVHDASVTTRADGGADLYYLRAASPSGLSVHRRSLRADGSLGPEQLVTSPSVGHVEKPQARRLPDGRLGLSFARRTPGETGEATFDLAFAVLAGDAPP